MEINKQTQNAGDNSRQYSAKQVVNNIYNQGITEERARDIYREMSEKTQKYTQEATVRAEKRIDTLERSLFTLIEQSEDSMACFADPAFQRVLREAQQVAVCSSDEDDYNMLAELLVCHVQKGDNKKNRSSIRGAINVIGDIDNDALCALTVIHAVNSYIPTSYSCKKGLATLNELFQKLMYMDLPSGNDWIDHLEELGVVKVLDYSRMRKLAEHYFRNLNGYVCIGIQRGSEDYKKAIDILAGVKLNSDILCDNELLSDYVRIRVCRKERLKTLKINDFQGTRFINTDEAEALEKVWNLYSNDAEDEKMVQDKFIELWDSYDSLNRLQSWYDSIEIGFKITSIGRVLAHTNAKRCDPNLPELEI